MPVFSGQIRLDYDSDSDDEELVKHKPIRSGVLASSTDSLLSQCPTTEHLPSLIASARSKEVVVVEAVADDEPLPTAADTVVEDPECDEALAALAEEALPSRAENPDVWSDAPVSSSSSETSSSSKRRASRAVRGRSGRRHRRDSGVSGRALRLVEAAELGPWPSSTFSKLCNLLKDAPPPPVHVRLTLRRAWSRPALQLQMQCPGLKDGSATLEQYEVFADRPEDAAALLSKIALQPLSASEAAAADDTDADADADAEEAPAGSLTAWPWSLVVGI